MQEKAYGLLMHPYAVHSGRQCRPHNGLQAFRNRKKQGLQIAMFSGIGVAVCVNADGNRIFIGVASSSIGNCPALIIISLDIQKALWYVVLMKGGDENA